MALVDSEQLKKSITNLTNVWHTILLKFVEEIVVNRLADASLINSYCEIWIACLTV